MSDVKSMAILIRQRFASAMPVGFATAHDNVEFSPTAGTPWCRFVVQFGVCNQADFGGTVRRWRTAGVALAQLFYPLEDGDGALLDSVSTIQDAFRGVTLAGPPVIAFGSPYITAPPLRQEGWWMAVVAIPFRADEVA